MRKFSDVRATGEGVSSPGNQRSATVPIAFLYPQAPTTSTCVGAIGWGGVGPIKRVRGNLNAARYQGENSTLHQANLHLTGPGRSRWLFVYNNAPAHNARATRDYLAAMRIPNMNWAGNWSDLNPIENIRAYVQRRMPKTLPRNDQELWAQLQTALNSVSVAYVRKVICSMLRRIAAVLQAKGGQTRY